MVLRINHPRCASVTRESIFETKEKEWTDECVPLPPVRIASFPLLDQWKRAAEGDGAASGNVFAQEASFWRGWGASDDSGRLIAPDGAGGAPEVDYLTLGRWALLPAADDVLEDILDMGRRDARRWAAANGWDADADDGDGVGLGEKVSVALGAEV